MKAGDKILSEIVKNLEETLSKCGLMYHIFYRTKSERSVRSKLKIKEIEYREKGKKMQDLLALRITLYFTDDVDMVHNHLKSLNSFVDESVDEAEVDRFCPKRLNLVMRVPESMKKDMSVAIKESGYTDLVDDTYEIQIRTILSEGWHEVEHDFRYKCKGDWKEYPEDSRLLNGVYATLESSEWSMLTLFDKLSYKQYKKKSWDSMLRNKMRVRFADKGLSKETKDFLTQNPETAKNIFRARRSKVLERIMNSTFSYPLTYDTVLHLINHIVVRNEELAKLEEDVLKSDMDILFGTL